MCCWRTNTLNIDISEISSSSAIPVPLLKAYKMADRLCSSCDKNKKIVEGLNLAHGLRAQTILMGRHSGRWLVLWHLRSRSWTLSYLLPLMESGTQSMGWSPHTGVDFSTFRWTTLEMSWRVCTEVLLPGECGSIKMIETIHHWSRFLQSHAYPRPSTLVSLNRAKKTFFFPQNVK